MSAGMVRVDRGDGKLFQFAPNDVKAFIDANPGAHVVPGRNGELPPTQAEEAATAALAAKGSLGPGSMTIAQLHELAQERGVAVPSKGKDAIIAALEAAEAAQTGAGSTVQVTSPLAAPADDDDEGDSGDDGDEE